MVKLMDCLKRFARNEDGAFIVLFGVMAVVLTALSGAVVDYTRMQEQRNRAQIALDSAALALQDGIFTRSSDDIRADAERLVLERAGGGSSRVWVEDALIDQEAGSLTLTGGLDVPMLFVRLVGVDNLTASITSQATRKKLRLEVAMVLDNSGSMANFNRMYHLQQAATNAVNILFDGEAVHNDVFMSVVPYTYHVNIGANNWQQFWVDRGDSRLSGDNFRFDPGTRNFIAGQPFAQRPQNYDPARPVNEQDRHVDRIWLYNRINNESWRGCVEARPHPLDVMDIEPRRVVAGGTPIDDSDVTGISPHLSWRETLFMPLFAPDLPDRLGSSGNNTYLQYVNDTGPQCIGTPPNNSSGDFERQERICKYIGVNISNSGDFRGPNVDCGRPLLPLTNSRAPIINAINAMVASGGTNIHMGAMWGWHVLSPNEPFPAEDYDDEDVSKVMILMTDGENTPYEITTNNANNPNGSWLFSAYGHPVNNQRSMTNTNTRLDNFIRLGKRLWNRAQLKAEMDSRLEQTCANAKDAGIRIYSIGLSVSAQADRDMMTRCATSSQDAYFTNDPSELNAVFEEIADQLSSLRLSL